MFEDVQRREVIEESESPLSSPVVLIWKNWDLHFYDDNRKLDDISRKENFPLPRIDGTLDTLAGDKWFSTLDLKSGYWQADLQSHKKTSFSTGQGLWQFSHAL
jgi:hypothetical protein